MSAPFPSPAISPRGSADPHADVFNPTRVIAIPERNAHIPSWYAAAPHQHPENITVTCDGLPLTSPAGADNKRSFTVAEVAPEFRWAIGPDGAVKPQHDFESELQRVYEEYCTAVLGTPFAGQIGRERRPDVRRYVSRCVNPQDHSKHLVIGYNPAETAGRKPTSLWTFDKQTGEHKEITGDNRMAVLVAAYRDPVLKKNMKPWEIEDVEKMLAASADLSLESIRQRAEAQPAAEPAAPVAAKPAKEKKQAPVRACGKGVWPMHFPKHKAKCPTCAGGEAA